MAYRPSIFTENDSILTFLQTLAAFVFSPSQVFFLPFSPSLFHSRYLLTSIYIISGERERERETGVGKMFIDPIFIWKTEIIKRNSSAPPGFLSWIRASTSVAYRAYSIKANFFFS